MTLNYKKTKLACYVGYVVQALVNNFLPILFIVFRQKYSLSYEMLGRIIFVNFFTQLIADISTPFIVKKIGYRGAAVLCHSLAAGGMILLAVLPRVMSNVYLSIILSVIVYAFGSGVIEVVISPMVELLPSKRKAASMAFLHSFYCWGQVFTVLVTTLLVTLFGYDNWFFIPLAWAVIPLVNLFAFMRVPVVEPDPEEHVPTAKELFFTREFFCFVIFMVCAGASEIAMAEWASVFAEQSLGVSKTVGDLLGPCAFAVFMGIGRVAYGAFSGRYSVRKALVFNNLLCVACYLTVAFCKLPVFSLLACALCGFSVSLSWPGTYSIAAARFKNGGTVMFSIFALSGDLGCSLGPWAFGAVADRFGLNGGFLVCAVFPLIMVAAALFLLKEKDCKIS